MPVVDLQLHVGLLPSDERWPVWSLYVRCFEGLRIFDDSIDAWGDVALYINCG